MNLNHLSAFHAVAEEGSVTRGAERLMVSQPAVSKQLKALERNLETPLFDRLPKGVSLTEAGTLLAGYARRLFALEAEAEQALGELRGLRRGRLSVGASTTVGVYLLPAVLIDLRRQHPGVQTHLEILDSGTLRRRLLDGTIDVGLTEGAVDDEDVESAILLYDDLVAIAPPGHPLARKRSVTAERLCREPFVVRETGSGTKSLVERALAERGLEVEPAMSLGSTEAIKRAVAAGVGLAIVSRLAVELELWAGTLATVKVGDLSIRRPIYRLRHRARQPSATVSAFLSLLDQAAVAGIQKPRGRRYTRPHDPTHPR